MRIKYYTSNIGVFLEEFQSGYYTTKNTKNYKINGIEYDIPLINGFYHLPKESTILTLDHFITPQKCVIGYELKISTFASEKIKPYLDAKEITKDDEGDWIGDFDGISGLYKNVYSDPNPYWESIELELVILGNLTITDYEVPQKMMVKLSNGTDKYVPKELELSSIVSYNMLTKMLTPEFLLHDRPCYMHPDNVYKIIRQFIIENIDAKVARITSNYDFCFTVQKIVKTKQINTQKETLTAHGRSYKPPRFVSCPAPTKMVEIFEMCPSKRYTNYTVIEGWSANSLKEMKENMDQYLTELMDFINMEVEECSHCCGTGHIIHKKLTNDRG